MKESLSFKAPQGMMRAFALYACSRYPVTGVELIRLASKLSKGLWKPSPGSVYFVLKRLREEGSILEISSEGEGERAYIITEKGKRTLSKMKDVLRRDLKKQALILSLLMDLAGIEDKVEMFKRLIEIP